MMLSKLVEMMSEEIKSAYTTNTANVETTAKVVRSLNKDSKKADVDDAQDKFSKAMSKMNEFLRDVTFDMWLEQDDPMLAALSDLIVPKFSYNIKKGTKETVQKKCDNFNLVEFIEYAQKNGHDLVHASDWQEKLNIARKACVAMFASNEIIEKDEDAPAFYAAFGEKYGKKVAIEKDVTKGYVIKCMQDAVDAIIYADETNGGKNKYRVHTKIDYAHMNNCMGNASKGLATKWASSDEFRALMVQVMGRIVTNGTYEIEYK